MNDNDINIIRRIRDLYRKGQKEDALAVSMILRDIVTDDDDRVMIVGLDREKLMDLCAVLSSIHHDPYEIRVVSVRGLRVIRVPVYMSSDPHVPGEANGAILVGNPSIRLAELAKEVRMFNGGRFYRVSISSSKE